MLGAVLTVGEIRFLITLYIVCDYNSRLGYFSGLLVDVTSTAALSVFILAMQGSFTGVTGVFSLSLLT